MYHASVWILSCLGTSTLKELLDQELNKHEDDEKFNPCQWDTTGWEHKENTKRRTQRDFDWCYWWFNKTFLYRKTKNYQFVIQGEIYSFHWSKNTASYIPWLYTTWDQMVASNMIHCILVLTTTAITQAFGSSSNNVCLS